MSPTPSVVIVGAGPRATGILLALARELGRRGTAGPLTVHVVDPFPAGAGRIWREDQPGEVWMNNVSDEITVHPAGTGPTLAEWSGRPGDYLPRRDIAGYLRDAFSRAVAAMPDAVTVTTRRTRAVRLTGGTGARRVHLGDGTALDADVVVLAQGHLDVGESGESGESGAAGHVPPGYTVDQDYSGIPGGADVLVRGFGLAFIDLMMMLSEGRGGRFERTPGNPVPTYRPSGEEPVLWVGSRRGVPYRSKIAGGVGRRTARYVTQDSARSPQSVRSLLTAEFVRAHYRALAGLDEPSRCAVDAGTVDSLTDAWVAGEVDGDEVVEALAAAVRDPADRWNLRWLDRPLEYDGPDGRDALERAVADHVRTNLARATGGRHPQDAALYETLVAVLPVLVRLLAPSAAGSLPPEDRSFVRRVCSAFSSVCSGPPPQRVGNLLALHEAGLVRFLGPDATFSAHGLSGYRATGSCLGGTHVDAAFLVDARLAELSADRVSDPLLQGLINSGEVSTGPGALGAEVVLVDGADRAVGRDGAVREDLFVVGPATSSPVREGFGRPGAGPLTRVFPANRAVAEGIGAVLEHRHRVMSVR